MHPHTILMLAAVALVWLFVAIVVGVAWLQRRGRLGPADRLVSFKGYGPILAGACSAGAAAVHLEVIGEHALRSASEPGASAVSFICSIGAGSAHFTSVDATVAGFLPLGVISIGLVGLQAAFAIPRVWQNAVLAAAGILVTAASLAVSFGPQLLGLTPSTAQGAAPPVATSDGLAITFELALLVAAGLLLTGRPRRILGRLRLKVADAYIGTGLGVGAILVFTVAGLFLGHAAH